MKLTAVEKEVYTFIKEKSMVKNDELVEKLNMSKRTIQRYKKRLKKKGIPIKWKGGKDGGCYIGRK